MKIHVKTLSGYTFTFNMEPSCEISFLKRRIREREGIHSKLYDLVFCDKILLDQTTLSENKIINESSIYLLVKNPKGEYKSKNVQTYLEWAPSWRSVIIGMNWSGVCENESCEAYSENVLSTQGIGVFELPDCFTCPVCNSQVKTNGFVIAGPCQYMCEIKCSDWIPVENGAIPFRIMENKKPLIIHTK